LTLVEKGFAVLRSEGVGTLARKTAGHARYRFDVWRMLRAVRAERRERRTLDETVRVAFGLHFGPVTIAPAQVESEIRDFLELVHENPPKTLLEIGSARGGTLFLLSRVATPDATLVSIDLPGGAFGGGYPREREKILKAFARDRQTVKLMQADSHDPRTLERVRGLFCGAPVDLLLIDGDHEYGGVKNDFEMYAPLVRPGGLIAVHDIVPGHHEAVGGVPDFWRELKDSRPVREIVESWDQGGYGIGIVTRGQGADTSGTPEPGSA
jgi:predicted O-methyltransferase YrrM